MRKLRLREAEQLTRLRRPDITEPVSETQVGRSPRTFCLRGSRFPSFGERRVTFVVFRPGPNVKWTGCVSLFCAHIPFYILAKTKFEKLKLLFLLSFSS